MYKYNMTIKRFLNFLCISVIILFTTDGFAATIPVIYSTDLMHPHDDPDDHFDVASLYSIPEADLRAIILDQGDRQSQRPGFKPVWQLNYLTGRHVPSAIGLRDKLKFPDDAGLDQAAEFQNGVNLILQTLQDSQEKVAIIFVGSARDVVAAYNRRPDLFRKKVRSIHGFIGEASNPAYQEWNVKLDPQAFIRLIRSDLPFYWIPCFDGGEWMNHGNASFWKIKHKDVLERTSEPIERFFLYMLRQSTDDPIKYLWLPTPAEERDWLMNGARNMWCGALLGLALNRPLLWEGREVVGFEPVSVTIDDNAVVHYGTGRGSRTVMRFIIKDKSHYSEAVTRATARLLEAFPLKEKPKR